MMTGLPESLILLALAGVLLRIASSAAALRAGIRPAGLTILVLAATLHWLHGRLDPSVLPASTAPGDAFDEVLRRHAVFIACGLGTSLLLIDPARQSLGTGLVLLAAAGVGLIAACDSAIWLIVGLYTVALATGLLLRIGNRSADSSERLVFQAICLALFLFGFSLLIVESGTLSLSGMRAQIRIGADQGKGFGWSGTALASSVLIMGGLSGFVCSFRLPWGTIRSRAAARIGPVAAASLLPAISAVLILLRLVPGLLSAWNPGIVMIVMITAVLMTGMGLLAAWLQTCLREMLGWACVVHAGLWYASLTVAGWDANHPDWSLTETGLPGGYTATLIALFCDAVAMLGVWATLSRLAGEGGAPQHPEELSGLLRQHPLTGAALSVCLLSLCGAPFLAGFWGRFWSMTAMFGPRQASSLTRGYEPHYGFLVLLAVSAAAQLLLCGLYLRLLQRVILEHPLGRIRSEGAASALITAVVLAGAILVMGLRPLPLMRAMTPRNVPVETLHEGPVPGGGG